MSTWQVEFFKQRFCNSRAKFIPSHASRCWGPHTELTCALFENYHTIRVKRSVLENWK